MKDYVVKIHYDDCVETEMIEANSVDEAAHLAAEIYDVDFNDIDVREWRPAHV